MPQSRVRSPPASSSAHSRGRGGRAPRLPERACDKLASPRGSNANRGTAAHPYRTVGKARQLVAAGTDRLPARGYLRGRIKVRKGGRAGAPTTIRSAPGARATVRGRLWVANSANHVVIQAALPERAQRRQAAQPDRQRKRRRVPGQRHHDEQHDHLLPARVRRVRPRAKHGDRAQSHPQLRGAATDQPPSRDLRGGLERRTHHRQLDLRQRRSRRAAVPGRTAHLRCAQCDRRQRRGRSCSRGGRPTTWSSTTLSRTRSCATTSRTSS